MVSISNDNLLTLIAHIIILVSVASGFIFSAISFMLVRKIPLNMSKAGDSLAGLNSPSTPLDDDNIDVEAVYAQSEVFKIYTIYQRIRSGAFAYMKTEILFFIPFILFVDSLLILCIGLTKGFTAGVLSALCFLTGSVSSLGCGCVGMAIATYSNARTTISARDGLRTAFVTAYTGALSYGFFLPSLGIFMIYSIVQILKLFYKADLESVYSNLAAYALGCSLTGLICRISGGIFTKAADVGADMVGKIEANLNEDDPRNPAVIADNVGDNVGDIAGMGADLYASFAECGTSALMIMMKIKEFLALETSMLFPVLYLSVSIVIGIITTLFATRILKPSQKKQIETTLKLQIVIFSLLMSFMSLLLCIVFLPSTFNVSSPGSEEYITTNINAFYCAVIGISGGAVIGITTEYYTSNAYPPVQELAQSSETGPASVIIFGLALGQKSTLFPVLILSIMLFSSFNMAKFFGVVMMTLGLLSLTALILTIDAYGPICDNAGGIAEMSELGESIRDRTDDLDSVGNTTAAVGKGFAIALAYFVAVVLLATYVELSNILIVNILNPFVVIGVLIGGTITFVFVAYLNRSVGLAAGEMVEEVRRQFRDNDVISGNTDPDYDECIRVAEHSSLYQTITPVLLTLTPVLVGLVLGDKALTGFLFGVQISGVPLAISSNNSGGAWDNAKKYIESGALGANRGKGSENHYASVIGDTVGDPLKDTSGPSINTLMKTIVILSVVLVNVFPKESLVEWLFG